VSTAHSYVVNIERGQTGAAVARIYGVAGIHGFPHRLALALWEHYRPRPHFTHGLAPTMLGVWFRSLCGTALSLGSSSPGLHAISTTLKVGAGF
jgi:hypothetical protein